MDKNYVPEIIRGNDEELQQQQQIELLLPAGFRFHPTDEELITHYLSKKVADSNFSAAAISDVDMNRVEPWDLPRKAKIGENEWYFFCIKDKKYPTGQRTNRATSSGYWKATGKDKEIFLFSGSQQLLVGMKKTLVFYKGRAPQGLKTNWVSHEYRLLDDGVDHNLPKLLQKDWVIMRVFHKTCGGKKLHISGLIRPIKPQLMVSSSRFSTSIIQDHDFIRDPSSMDYYSSFNWGKFHDGGVLSQDNHDNNNNAAALMSSTDQNSASGKKSYQEEQPSSSFEANDHLDFIWSF